MNWEQFLRPFLIDAAVASAMAVVAFTRFPNIAKAVLLVAGGVYYFETLGMTAVLLGCGAAIGMRFVSYGKKSEFPNLFRLQFSMRAIIVAMSIFSASTLLVMYSGYIRYGSEEVILRGLPYWISLNARYAILVFAALYWIFENPRKRWPLIVVTFVIAVINDVVGEGVLKEYTNDSTKFWIAVKAPYLLLIGFAIVVIPLMFLRDVLQLHLARCGDERS